MSMEMTYRIDTYKNTPRIFASNKVVGGLVAVASRGGYSYYEVRENGETIKHVAGLSKLTIQQAKIAAEKTASKLGISLS